MISSCVYINTVLMWYDMSMTRHTVTLLSIKRLAMMIISSHIPHAHIYTLTNMKCAN